ncbi:MAG TPA: Hsp20/alpha crystallin family protein [Woeseiaceae bacterium]|nr:Hsp20/alpha crystallin family protein [Woeseiaceae bacterium]
MNLTRFEPWGLVDMLHRDLDRLAARQMQAGDSEAAVTDWVPAVDIIEEKDRFVLRADVPGVDPADIEVSMDAGVLSIAGQRAQESRSEEAGLQRMERVSGRFFRRFSLPDTADAENIAAQCRNGILEVSIPKQPQVQARRIEVHAA